MTPSAKLTRLDGTSLIERNRAVHRLLVEGVTVEYKRPDGGIAGAQARVIDFADPAANDTLAVNQFAVAEGQHTRRPDVVLFLGGLPLAVLELKNAAAENATIWDAPQQLQTWSRKRCAPRCSSARPKPPGASRPSPGLRDRLLL